MKIRSLKNFLLGLCLITLSGCSSLGAKKESAPRLFAGVDLYTSDFPEVSESSLVNSVAQNRIRVGDVADILVHNVEQLTNTYPVGLNGNINMPLIGPQKASGLTAYELQENLSATYGKNLLNNPVITVKVESFPLGKVVVDGAVDRPGVFELVNPIRLTEAVALAGGLDEDANQQKVYMVREIEGKKSIKIVNLEEVRILGANDPYVYPEDIVYVQNDITNETYKSYQELLKSVPLLSLLVLLGTR